MGHNRHSGALYQCPTCERLYQALTRGAVRCCGTILKSKPPQGEAALTQRISQGLPCTSQMGLQMQGSAIESPAPISGEP
jgi:hypothetical protein